MRQLYPINILYFFDQYSAILLSLYIGALSPSFLYPFFTRLVFLIVLLYSFTSLSHASAFFLGIPASIRYFFTSFCVLLSTRFEYFPRVSVTVILMSEEYFFPSFVIPVTIITPFPPEVPAVTVPFWSTLTFFKFLVLNDIF